MEAVVDAGGLLAEHRDSKVQHEVLECAVLDEEIEVENFVFGPCVIVSKVLVLVEVKLRTAWALHHKDEMCHLKAHLVDV